MAFSTETKTLRADADLHNADWTKQTWDLPPYGSPEFDQHLKDHGMTEEQFSKLPASRGRATE